MRALPDEVFPSRPVLNVLYVAPITSNGGIVGVESRLQNAERWLESISDKGERPKDMIVVKEDEFRRLPARWLCTMLVCHWHVAMCPRP
jgi:LuxR family maltose regulon positive regulatory protein